MFMDTISPLLGYLMPSLAFMFMGIDGEGGTALPEALASDETFKDMGTVEKLAEGYKAQSSRTYLDFFSDEAKNDPNMNKYKTADELYAGHKSAVELIGKKGVIMPGENPSETEIATYREGIGVPKTSAEYVFTPANDLHEEIKITPEFETSVKEMMHKRNIPSKEADGLFQDYLALESAALTKRDEGLTTKKQETETSLRAELGADYTNSLAMANKVVEKFGGEEGVKEFGELGNNPAVLKTLIKIGKALSEDGVPGNLNLNMDSGGAKSRIAEIEKDPAYLDETAITHKALVTERTKLYNIAYPEE